MRLLDIGGNWNTPSIQSIPNMLNGWQAWWVCRPWKNWDIFSIQELCTDQHGAVHYHAETWGDGSDEWHDNGPQDLTLLSLCIQIAIDQIQLCSLFVAYACPYHNPTMGQLSKPLAHTTAQYSWNRYSSLKSTLLQRASGHQRGVFAHWSRLRHAKLQSVQDPGEDDEHADGFSKKCTCVMILLFNQLIDMPPLSGVWVILAKEKGPLTGTQTNLITKGT